MACFRRRMRVLSQLVAPVSLVALVVLAPAWAGCVDPVNPCDPNAPDDVKAAGTRISGVVRDQHGAPRGGVLVSVSGRPETAVSADDGSFTLAALPPAP